VSHWRNPSWWLGGGSEVDCRRWELVKQALLDVSQNSLVVWIGRGAILPFVHLMASLHKIQSKHLFNWLAIERLRYHSLLHHQMQNI